MNQSNQVKLKLYSYDHRLLDKSIKQIIEIARNFNCEIKGPIPLPTKKEIFTICRSVHVDKPSREQFERRTHKRLIMLCKTTPQVLVALRHLVMPTGVDVHIDLGA
jgi:small subunit ribosomal protein S10